MIFAQLPSDVQTLQSAFPKYASYFTVGFILLTAIGRAITAIRNDGGVLAIWNSIVFGSTTTKDAKSQPVSGNAGKLGLMLAAIGGSLWLAGCQVSPGSDPLVVRVEQAETGAYSTFDTFLKVDDIAMQNAAVSNSWAGGPHAFAQYLRKPILNGTNTVPFGIATILSLDQIKSAYEAGTSTSNALVTALDTLSTTVAQASQYTSLVATNN